MGAAKSCFEIDRDAIAAYMLLVHQLAGWPLKVLALGLELFRGKSGLHVNTVPDNVRRG